MGNVVAIERTEAPQEESSRVGWLAVHQAWENVLVAGGILRALLAGLEALKGGVVNPDDFAIAMDAARQHILGATDYQFIPSRRQDGQERSDIQSALYDIADLLTVASHASRRKLKLCNGYTIDPIAGSLRVAVRMMDAEDGPLARLSALAGRMQGPLETAHGRRSKRP